MGNAKRIPVSWDQITPRLRGGVRLCHDQVRAQDALLHPEGVALLNATAAATLALVDGKTNVAHITQALSRRFQGARAEDVLGLLSRLEAARLVELRPAEPSSPEVAATRPAAKRASVTRTAPGGPRVHAPPADGASPGLPLGLAPTVRIPWS
jgi:coenzyme PQQ biosynthesis protein PqqD